MKKNILLIIVQFFLIQNTFCQSTSNSEKDKINAVLTEFMQCIETKDSIKMYKLFHKGPVTWIGVYKEATHKEMLKRDSAEKNYEVSDYKTWFRRIATPPIRREDFSNIEIIEDGSVASVTFDYSFGEIMRGKIGE